MEKERKFNILRGIIMGSFLNDEQKEELIGFVTELEGKGNKELHVLLKLAKFLYRHVSKFGLDYDDDDVKKLGNLIEEMETKIKESEE